jgi:hypothetical protein
VKSHATISYLRHSLNGRSEGGGKYRPGGIFGKLAIGSGANPQYIVAESSDLQDDVVVGYSDAIRKGLNVNVLDSRSGAGIILSRGRTVELCREDQNEKQQTRWTH